MIDLSAHFIKWTVPEITILYGNIMSIICHLHSKKRVYLLKDVCKSYNYKGNTFYVNDIKNVDECYIQNHS